MTERFADGLCTVDELRHAADGTGWRGASGRYVAASERLNYFVDLAAKNTGSGKSMEYAASAAKIALPTSKEWKEQARLFRDIFMNPFHRATVDEIDKQMMIRSRAMF